MKSLYAKLLTVLTFIFMANLSAFAVDLDAIRKNFPKLNDITIPEITKIELDNGMKVYLAEDHSLPLIDANVRISGGEYIEPAEKIGLVDVMGDLLKYGGTQKWSPDELEELLDGIGAHLHTNADLIACYADELMLSNNLDLSIELLAEVLRRPRFDKDRFDQLIIGYKASIQRRNDRDSQIANREFNKLIYGKDSVFARQAEYKHINSITIEDLKEYHKKIFAPEHVQLSIKTNEMIKIIKKYFADWEKGNYKLPEYPKVEYNFDTKVCYVNRPDAKQSNIYMGHIGGKLLDEDHPHRIVMNNLLGVGFSSRLFKEVRSKHGLCYSVYGAYTANITYPGKFLCYVGTKCSDTVQAMKLIIKEIKRLQEELPTEQEVKSAKDRYLNTFVFNFENKGQILSRMLTYDFFGIPSDFLNKQKEGVEKTTPADVTEAAKKYLQPDKLRMVVLGNMSEFSEPLESLEVGKPEELDISIPQDTQE